MKYLLIATLTAMATTASALPRDQYLCEVDYFSPATPGYWIDKVLSPFDGEDYLAGMELAYEDQNVKVYARVNPRVGDSGGFVQLRITDKVTGNTVAADGSTKATGAVQLQYDKSNPGRTVINLHCREIGPAAK